MGELKDAAGDSIIILEETYDRPCLEQTLCEFSTVLPFLISSDLLFLFMHAAHVTYELGSCAKIMATSIAGIKSLMRIRVPPQTALRLEELLARVTLQRFRVMDENVRFEVLLARKALATRVARPVLRAMSVFGMRFQSDPPAELRVAAAAGEFFRGVRLLMPAHVFSVDRFVVAVRTRVRLVRC